MPKYFFTLKNIDTFAIEDKYNICTRNFSLTKISQLSSTPITQNYIFVDETMQTQSCIITMSKLLNKKLPLSTKIHCFWCRYPFCNPPIGCPIEYVSHILYKHYYSELSKDTYSIKGSITPKMQELIQNLIKDKNDNLNKIDNKNFYLTDGIFCSFNCCLAFIKNNSSLIYTESENLLCQYFHNFFNKKIIIEPAPSWRLLINYGGHLSIEQYRKNFNIICYKNLQEIVKVIPGTKVLGFLFEKKIKF